MEGTPGNPQKLRQIMKSYQSRLSYNDLPLRVIMYKCNHLFEYNPYTSEIRPFNALYWYSLEEENDLYNFISYIKKKYNDIIQNDLMESDIGFISGEILSIDLDNLGEDIIPRIHDMEKKERQDLMFSYNDFIFHVSSLYDKWKDIINSIENI